VRATTILNAELCWDAYEGPLQPVLCHGQLTPLLDVRRVLLHELGHVLGLEHPDEGGQTVAAIMNHTTSDVDSLQADDEAGILALYPPPPVAAQRQEVSAAAADGGHGGGGGCAMGTGGIGCHTGIVGGSYPGALAVRSRFNRITPVTWTNRSRRQRHGSSSPSHSSPFPMSYKVEKIGEASFRRKWLSARSLVAQ
jgi:hypothetical protein